MHLYVLGPAFGLPSIDAECIAAAALLKLKAGDEEWSIVPTHTQTIRLPYLTTADGKTIEGFHNIARHLGHDAASSLDDQRRADAIALANFVQAHAQPLLDISLYVAFDNYVATRSAFTKILPWYANYSLPPARRAAARMRTAHLGIESIDIDDAHEDLSNRPAGFDVGKEPLFEAETQKRASLLLGHGRNTVRGMLSRKREHAAVFKLHALADGFFAPLQDMLDALIGANEPGYLDCLVYGYLSLMLLPALPQDWLAKTMRRKYARLVRLTERLHQKLGLETDVDAVMALAESDSQPRPAVSNKGSLSLPWEAPTTSSAAEVVRTTVGDLVSQAMIWSTPATIVRLRPQTSTLSQQLLPITVAVTATFLGLFGYHAFTTGRIVWPHGEQVHIFGQKRFSDYGHLGAALAGVGLLSKQAEGEAAYHQRDEMDNPAKVEVQI